MQLATHDLVSGLEIKFLEANKDAPLVLQFLFLHFWYRKFIHILLVISLYLL